MQIQEKYNPKSKEDRNPRDFKEADRGACCSMVFTESNHILSSVKKVFTFHCWEYMYIMKIHHSKQAMDYMIPKGISQTSL